jgi:hypothetical protein
MYATVVLIEFSIMLFVAFKKTSGDTKQINNEFVVINIINICLFLLKLLLDALSSLLKFLLELNILVMIIIEQKNMIANGISAYNTRSTLV